MSRAQHCFLGMPTYGELTVGAARAFWRASARPGLTCNARVGSLLAQNFNRLWVDALNAVKAGTRVDYFAMLHDDVEAEDYWLDRLVDELEARDLDVLGAAVPIKDRHGLTSLALAHPSGDPWRILARLSMTEVYRLPETFTSEDVGHPLLLNTGCWVCKFDPAWAAKVRFEIRDRTVFNEATDRYESQVIPEDWFWSRQLHDCGLRVGATRKVRIAHVGPTRYLNTETWGEVDHDTQHVGESPIPPQPLDGWRFPRDVDGWLTETEGRGLAELARGKRVLEIGSYCGRSTICMAQTAEWVTAVDPHDGRGTPKPKDTFAELKANLERYGVREKVRVIRATSAELPVVLDADADLADLVFIDGDHEYDGVRSDIEHVRSLLAPGGVLAFHDYRVRPGHHDGRDDPGVRRAVNELVAGGGELLRTHGTVAVVKPAGVPCPA